MWNTKHQHPRSYANFGSSGLDAMIARHTSAPPCPPVNYSCQPGTTVEPIKVGTPAPANPTVAQPAPMPSSSTAPAVTPAPILNSFNASTATKKEPIDVTPGARMACAKDRTVMQNAMETGCASGFVKGVEKAIITGGTSIHSIPMSTLSGCVTGAFKGQMTAAETCVPALPSNPPPRVRKF